MLITYVATIIPSIVYSGFIAPVTSQGPVEQVVSFFVPATHFMVIVRGIYLKDIPAGDMITNLSTLFLVCLHRSMT
jgi:ABC-2 type transport system permease protein